MKKADIVARLRTARLFRVLSKSELEGLADSPNVASFEPDTTIFFRGDGPDHVYFILEGRVAVETLSNNGKAFAISTLESGEVFGEMAVLDGQDRSANIRTLDETVLLLINNRRFNALTQDNPAFAREVIQDLVRRLRLSDAKFESIMFYPLKRRLAELLIQQFNAYGDVLIMTQAELAYQLSATREKVNVSLQAMQRAGAIKLARGRITLLDAQILLRMK